MSLGKLSKLMDSLSKSSISLYKCVEVKKKKKSSYNSAKPVPGAYQRIYGGDTCYC